jgi:uncharacterized protein DUF1707/2TM domain-containing protein
MAQDGAMRASDAERERAAAELRQHYAEGRLSSEELSERLDAAYAATTQGQLAEPLVDLPLLATEPTPVSGGRSPAAKEDPAVRELARRRVYQDAGAVVLVNVLCVVVWLATGADGQFWPVWVMLVSAFRLAQDAWRLLGPGGDPSLATLDRRDRRRVERERRRELGR